ncbi:MAG: BatA and WFA domain-containing protein [Phycisphaera sp.]|nr:MAG: BatA and WFA domain-containing protein [Phycisphaera sp.]
MGLVTLLAPWAALFAAGLTVPPIIAFYLLKLRRRPVRVGSVMFWERAVRDAQGNTPWRMVRPHTQLLLQLLGLALLLLAFGRPAIPSELGGRVMLVLDRSASMNSTDGPAGITRFEQARERLRELASDLASANNTRVMVVALGSEALPLTPWTSDRSVLLGAIDAAEPTDEEGSANALAGLVRLAAAGDDAADVAGTEMEPPSLMGLTVVLASDGGLAPPSEPLAANIELRLEPVGGAIEDPPGNAGIVAIAAQRSYEDPAMVRVFARVLATGEMRRDLPVRLALDGQVIAEGIAKLSSTDDTDGPIEATVGLSTVTVDGGVLSVLLPGQDVLSADDSASLWLRPAGRPRVLQVIPETEIVDPDRPGPVLLIAAVLEAMDLGTLRIVRLSRYEQLAAAGDLPFDAIVFDRVSPSVPPRVPSLHFGPPPPAPDGTAWPTADPGTLPGTRVIAWRRTHPVMRDLTLGQLSVAEPIIAADLQDGGGAMQHTILASGERAPLIIGFEDQQQRRIWVGFEPAMSNWPKLVSFPLFIAEAIDYLSMRGARDAADSIRAGDLATPMLAQARSTIRLIGQNGDFELSASSPTTRPAIGPIERAGVYLLEEASTGDQRAVAVNVTSELESEASVRPELPSGFGGLVGGFSRDARSGGEQELWPWFLLAGLVVLTLEWFLSARTLGR